MNIVPSTLIFQQFYLYEIEGGLDGNYSSQVKNPYL